MKKRMRIAALFCSAAMTAAALSANAGAAAAPSENVLAQLPLMYERIAAWDEVSVEDCYARVNAETANNIAQFYTPKKAYQISWQRSETCRVKTYSGKAPQTETILADWGAQIAKKTGSANALDPSDIGMEITETETPGEFQITVNFACLSVSGVSYPDVLSADPDVQQISRTSCFHTNDRPNRVDAFGIVFDTDKTVTPEDFPETGAVSVEYFDLYQGWVLKTGENKTYADYYPVFRQLLTRDDISDPSMLLVQTQLADISKDSFIDLDDWSTVFYRGDLNTDDEIDVVDAVLLARLIAEDADVPVTEQGAGNADANADGELSVLDVTSVLHTILKSL